MRAFLLSRLISSLPVRGRTVALSLAPLLGLLAIGMAYMSGERHIAVAFANMTGAAQLSEASRDLRYAAETMHTTANDFVIRPNTLDLEKFANAHGAALRAFDGIAALATSADREDLAQMQSTVVELNSFFGSLVEQQRLLGFDDTQGLRARLRESSGNIERLIHEGVILSHEVHAVRMLASLEAMRRLELQFIAWHDELDVRVKFFAELGNFNRILGKTEIDSGVKAQIRNDVTAYTDIFRELMSLTGHINSFLAAIDKDTQQLIPAIDRHVETARANLNGAMTSLTESRARITTIVIAVAGLAILLGVGLSSLIGIGINAQNLRFDAALNNMSQGLCMLDANFRIIVCNRRYRQMFGDSRNEMPRPGTSMLEMFRHGVAHGNHPGITAERLYDEFTARLTCDSSGIYYRELPNKRLISISYQPMANGGWVCTYEDITEKRRAEERIAHLAHHDALTDLPNRLLLRQRLGQALGHLAQGERTAVLCLDLDRFKTVNDTLGHPIGDALLLEVTSRLRTIVPEPDTISRLGGDEFAIIRTAISGAADITTLASRMIEKISEPYALGDHQIVIGVSIGIALAPEDGGEADQLLKHADMALYRAKADGRGTYRFFEPSMDARMQARRSLEIDLRRALDADEFQLHYQPLVNLLSREVSGFEALLRWNHPVRGRVSPAEFIPLAEEIGLIVPIGEWVLRQACREAASWPTNLTVAVNLSPVQFDRSRDLVGSVAFALGASRLSPDRLELEITESVLLRESDTTLATLHQLRDLGVRIGMDDFGTGYSSLSYLRSFPFDKIKIDQSFVRDLSLRDDCLAIVRAVTGLGGSLGITTVAEGVETQEQLEALRNEGCTEAQGYFLSPPRPASEIRPLLETLGRRLVA
jgi:diguanylate cyclase (GGDEF)-like protein